MKDALQQIPVVGPRTAADLRALGIERVEDLAGRDPEELYARLCALQGGHSDRCNLYVYRCAIYWSEGGRERRLLDWWAWKDAARPRSAGYGTPALQSSTARPGTRSNSRAFAVTSVSPPARAMAAMSRSRSPIG